LGTAAGTAVADGVDDPQFIDVLYGHGHGDQTRPVTQFQDFQSLIEADLTGFTLSH
jgi:hypothetical protein